MLFIDWWLNVMTRFKSDGKKFLYWFLLFLLVAQFLAILIVGFSVPTFFVDQWLLIFSTVFLFIYLIWYKQINNYVRTKSSFLRFLFLIIFINLPMTMLLITHFMTQSVPFKDVMKLYAKGDLYTVAYSNLFGSGQFKEPTELFVAAVVIVIIVIIADVLVMQNIASFAKHYKIEDEKKYFNLTLYKDMMNYGNSAITVLIIFSSILVVVTNGSDVTAVTKELQAFFYGVYIYILPIQGMLIYLSDKDV